MFMVRRIVRALRRFPAMIGTRRPRQRPIVAGVAAVSELLEERQLLSAAVVTDVRSIDGTGNNLAHADWGSAGTELLRTAASAYRDGISAPAGADRPGAREISNALADQAGEDIISDRELSAMIYAWGQFIDHDLDLTPSGTSESLPVPVPTGDPSFDPNGTGTATIAFSRSLFDPATGVTTAREQINTVTSWLDGSMIYGSDSQTAASLRTMQGGRLKTSEGNLLPVNDATTFPDGTLAMGNDAHRVPNDELFAAGDVRANENIELTSLQTLFVREHNRIADQLAGAHRDWSDERIYQAARAQVIGELQAITYNEWLPALLGKGAIDPYRGYDASVNPSIANEFSTAAFRVGHTLLGDDVEFLGNDGRSVADGVPLSEAFSNPELLATNGIDSILKYLSSDPASEVDTKVVDSVRNFLFGPPGAGGLDLASLNIQRGRDHGLADYNSIRQAYGLPAITDFQQITANVEVQTKLRDLYGTVDNIDAWVGMLAEDHVPGSSVGPTLRAVIADQFERLRDGDRFWFERTFTGVELRNLERTTLADVIHRNTGDSNLQGNVFFFQASVAGTVFADGNRNNRADRNEPTLSGKTVELVDGDGAVVATTLTDARGRYQFDVSDGLRTGIYSVRVTTAEEGVEPLVSRSFTITRGGQFLTGIDLGTAPTGSSTGSHHFGRGQSGDSRRPAPAGAARPTHAQFASAFEHAIPAHADEAALDQLFANSAHVATLISDLSPFRGQNLRK